MRNLLRSTIAFSLIVLGFAAAVEAQDKKLTTVYLGYSAISGSFAPLWVGFDQGLFAKHGIDLKMAYIQGNRVMMSALTAGEIHIYQGGAEGLIRLVSGGGDGIFIATQYNFVNHYVLMTDPSITRLEDLRGKRLALDPTSPTYGYMLKVSEQVGLKKEDVSFVQFGTVGQPERAMAVMRKQAAATILTAPNTYAAEKQGLRKFSIIRELGIRQLITVSATTKKFLREKREAADALSARLRRSARLCKSQSRCDDESDRQIHPPARPGRARQILRRSGARPAAHPVHRRRLGARHHRSDASARPAAAEGRCESAIR